MKVKTATKKPVVIEFIEWTGSNLVKVISFIDGKPYLTSDSARGAWESYVDLVERDGLIIETLEGQHIATIGDMIIKGVHGEFYPCKPDIFAKTYTVND